MRNKVKELDFETRKRMLLDMLVEIDAFCKEKKINYILDSGTMIGAIRHHGYIPWDDDVDIAMGKEDLLRFKKEFNSPNLKYCDIYTEKGYQTSFSRISHRKSFQIWGKDIRIYGLYIDLHVIVGIKRDQVDPFLEKGTRMRIRRQKLDALRKKIAKHTNSLFFPFFKFYVKKMRKFVMKQPAHEEMFFVHCGPFKQNYVFDFNPLESVIHVPFEGHFFPVPKLYDVFLTHKYGDYMKMPPLEKRKPYHGVHFYIEDEDDEK